MHSQLDIQVNGKSLVLPDDFSLSVEESNEIFNDGRSFSYPVIIPTKGNAAILKNISHIDSDTRISDLDHIDARVFADGLPLNAGQVITQSQTEIGKEFAFNIDDKNKSLSELVNDLTCRDIPVKDNIVIGEKIGTLNFSGYVDYYTYGSGGRPSNSSTTRASGTTNHGITYEKVFQYRKTVDDKVTPQALGYSYPAKCVEGEHHKAVDSGNKTIIDNKHEFIIPVEDVSYINVSQPYPFPYCNARVCYNHIGSETKTEDGETVDVSTGSTIPYSACSEKDKETYPYFVLDANRPTSGICFYVLYFLDCLFDYLKINFDKSELLEIEDFKRLCFFTTRCCYTEEPLTANANDLNSLQEINDWLSSRGIGNKISLHHNQSRIVYGTRKRGDDEQTVIESDVDENGNFNARYTTASRVPGAVNVGTTQWYVEGHVELKASLSRMMASSENFPNVSVMDIINSLESSFGIKFVYDDDRKTMKARLYRNIFNNHEVREFNGTVLSMVPISEKILGVEMKYSTESDIKEQNRNVKLGIKDYDTDYDYIDYPEDRTILNETYSQIVNEVAATNNKVYVDLTTGNSYRVKIDDEADDVQLLHPVLFQVGQFKGIQVGDCSKRDGDDTVKEFVSSFVPLKVNIANAYSYNQDDEGIFSPIYAPLLDVDMEHECVLFQLQYVGFNHKQFSLYCQCDMHLIENYDPTTTNNGDSPLQELDCGLTIGVMRGGGGNSEIIEFERGYDGFDNSLWMDIVGTYNMTSDTMDHKGAVYDYNGTEEGIGNGERISLQIKSYASFVYYIDDNMKVHINKDTSLAGKGVIGTNFVWRLPCNDDVVVGGNVIKKIRSRGLYDTFMKSLIHFILHRKSYKVKVLTTIAQLFDIRSHWADCYVINGKVGWINRINYNISKINGVGVVELEFYSL